jgi:hypothetical protein
MFKVGDIIILKSEELSPITTKLEVRKLHDSSFDYKVIQYSDASMVGKIGTNMTLSWWKLADKSGLAKFVELQEKMNI